MLRRLGRPLSYANVMSSVAVFLALGGAAYAAAGVGGTTIHGCVSKRTGVLRVLSKGMACRSSELKLGFNQEGPPGASGATGSAGQPGTPGTPGTSGTPGAAIVARASGSNTVQSISAGNAYPLTGNTWTQGAGEDDLIFGTMVVQTSPPLGTNGTTECDLAGGRGLFLNLSINGQGIGQEAFFDTSLTPFTVSVPSVTGTTFASNELPFVLSTGSARPDTLTASIADDCGDSAHYTVSNLQFDVVRFS